MKDLAFKADIPYATLRQYSGGKGDIRSMSAFYLLRIAQELDVDPYILAGMKDFNSSSAPVEDPLKR